MTLADAQALFEPEPGWLNTASYGLSPKPSWDAQSALDLHSPFLGFAGQPARAKTPASERERTRTRRM